MSTFTQISSNDKSYLEWLEKVKSVLFGVATGDALGVPVEFRSRERIAEDPVIGMRGYGTYNLPPGTWSDDSSLTFCLAEALTKKFSLNVIGQYFVDWVSQGFWAATGEVFDIGMTTRDAISNIEAGVIPHLAGSTHASSNGNGSLMRILPLLFYIDTKQVDKRFEITQKVSSITHGHIRSSICCFYYLEFARYLLKGRQKEEIYSILQSEIPALLARKGIASSETDHLKRLLENNIKNVKEGEIKSSGYVLHTLEASIWCLLTTESYEDAVLKAVNLGEDTDTTGAVTGGLAGLLYGYSNIPKEWIEQLSGNEAIEGLAKRLAKATFYGKFK